MTLRSVLDKVMSPFGLQTKQAPSGPRVKKNSRFLEAGQIDDLLDDFKSIEGDAIASMSTLDRVRGRSRTLCANDTYAKHFLRILKDNVLGPKGIRFDPMAVNPDGKMDKNANDLLKSQWAKWSKRKVCTVDGRLNWKEVERVALETIARDGEVLVRKIAFPNEFGYAVQLLECDHLETSHNEDLRNGNLIRMGVESDKWGRPVAYWLWPRHPGEISHSTAFGQKIRVPANEMLHLFITERVGQVRGLPWMTPAAIKLKMLGGYAVSEVVAARIAASKMGVIENPDGSSYDGQDEDDDGNQINEVRPGSWEYLKAGQKFNTFDPQHPNANFQAFNKAMLRGIAAGLGVSYNNLAQDLEGVNYSSLRSGDLRERDVWKCLQSWFSSHLHEGVYAEGDRNWLTFSFLTGRLDPLPFSKFEKFSTANWRPRGWNWVDPDKEAKSEALAVKSKLRTFTSVLADRGIDLVEHLEELKYEKELAEEMGVDLMGGLSDPEPSDPPTPDEGNEPKGDEDDADKD